MTACLYTFYCRNFKVNRDHSYKSKETRVVCDSILTVSLLALITLTRNTERFSNYSLF